MHKVSSRENNNERMYNDQDNKGGNIALKVKQRVAG